MISGDTSGPNHGPLLIVDGHCDSILPVMGTSLIPGEKSRRDFLVRNEIGPVDLPRLIEGGVACQVMALFCDDEALKAGAARSTFSMLDTLQSLFEASEGRFFPAYHAADAAAAKAAGKVSALIAVEGGEAIEGDLGLLRIYYRLGVRLMGLTWNRRNELGRGVRAQGEGGLTKLGRACVAEMERLGMIVDASHLSDEALDDLLAVARRPVVASHSNARAVEPDARNLDDAHVEAIAATGGVVGLTFASGFVAAKAEDVGLKRFLDHVDHIVKVGGIGCAALGTDFDGYNPSQGAVLRDCSRLPDLVAALRDRGYGEDEAAAIMGRNWLRVFREVLG